MSWQDDYLYRYYYGRVDWQGGTEEFWDWIVRYVRPGAEVLELGCGPANPTSEFLTRTFPVVDGLDIDDACRGNTHLRNAYVYNGGAWPMDDDAYDAVVANYVLEHVESPAMLLREARRVLRPGGVFVFRTPNRWHYVSVVSRLTPHGFHERIANRLRNLPTEAEEPYPTFYRMNSMRTLRRLAAEQGLACPAMEAIEKEPSYGLAHKALFLLFLLYERCVNSAAEFAFARSNILGVFQTPEKG